MKFNSNDESFFERLENIVKKEESNKLIVKAFFYLFPTKYSLAFWDSLLMFSFL